MLLLKVAELLLLANCWRVNEIWSASIVAGYFHCWILADFSNAPSSVCLKRSQGSSRESCHHVRALIWVWVDSVVRPTGKKLHFGMGWVWEQSIIGSQFSASLLLDIPGMVPERVHYRVLNRKMSNLDRAPKMPDTVLLIYWDSFLVTLPSISSETWVVYSSVILGTDKFCDSLLLGWSRAYLATAANFRLFLGFAMLLDAKSSTIVMIEIFFNSKEFVLVTYCCFPFSGEITFNQRQINDLQNGSNS